MAADQYPAARRLDLTEDLLGYRVSDPYRWLEDPGSAEDRVPGWASRTNCSGRMRRPCRG